MAAEPLQKYLGAQKVFDKDLAATLRDAADEARKLTKGIVGTDAASALRRRELLVLRRELLDLSETYWAGTTSAITRNRARAAVAATDAHMGGQKHLWKSLGVSIPQYDAAVTLRAVANVQALAARRENAVALSQNVYRARALANGWVDREINRSILLGESADQMANRVARMIQPNVPGGVSYAAFRLGRTELNNAFHSTQIALAQSQPWTVAVKWHLSGSHPRPDACNDYAESVHYKGGELGHFRPSEVPSKPHPNCLCFTTAATVSEDAFIDNFINGNYTSHVDGTIYENFPGVVC